MGKADIKKNTVAIGRPAFCLQSRGKDSNYVFLCYFLEKDGLVQKYRKKLMKIKENIALIGMPAVGKSTVGVLLAKKLGFEFLDTDILIQTKEQMTLARIIAEKGLERFLEIEESHLLGLDCLRHVIATGGSVIYREKTMARLAHISTIIYLAVDLSILATRLSDVIERGVAIDPGKGIDDLYNERTPLYDKYCDIKIECRANTPAQVVTAIEQYLP
jgi:shikimate kinase